MQQGNYNNGTSGNGTDGGAYGIGIGSGGDGNGNNGSGKKVRRARTPSLHPACMSACKRSTAACAHARPCRMRVPRVRSLCQAQTAQTATKPQPLNQ